MTINLHPTPRLWRSGEARSALSSERQRGGTADRRRTHPVPVPVLNKIIAEVDHDRPLLTLPHKLAVPLDAVLALQRLRRGKVESAERREGRGGECGEGFVGRGAELHEPFRDVDDEVGESRWRGEGEDDVEQETEAGWIPGVYGEGYFEAVEVTALCNEGEDGAVEVRTLGTPRPRSASAWRPAPRLWKGWLPSFFRLVH